MPSPSPICYRLARWFGLPHHTAAVADVGDLAMMLAGRLTGYVIYGPRLVLVIARACWAALVNMAAAFVFSVLIVFASRASSASVAAADLAARIARRFQ